MSSVHQIKNKSQIVFINSGTVCPLINSSQNKFWKTPFISDIMAHLSISDNPIYII